jgi:monofunctional biosynthetic peptidoglycan transglycosylase
MTSECGHDNILGLDFTNLKRKMKLQVDIMAEKSRNLLKWFFSYKKKSGKFSTTIFILKTGLLFVLFLFAAFITAYIFSPDVSRFARSNPTSTSLIDARNAERAEKGLPSVKLKYWVKYKSIPVQLVRAVRIAEDDGFFSHNGFDLNQLWEAIKAYFSNSKKLRGASTITQQLAKNLYLSEKRSFLRKFLEIPITIKLERALTKKRIFEIYLNVIEFGDGIFGIERASKFYFGKHAIDLNLDECVKLAAMVKRPIYFQNHPNSKSLAFRKRMILERMEFYGYLD